MKITKVRALEVLDSRGNPTVEAFVELEANFVGRSMVPSGASKGAFEALELRDNDKKRYLGKGVKKAVLNINKIISSELVGKDIWLQKELDDILISLDGTFNKSFLGANAILAVSMAFAYAAAAYQKKELFSYLSTNFYDKQQEQYTFPIPMFNILNGGMHADNNLDIQEFMILPLSSCNISEAIRMSTEVYHCLKEVLLDEGLKTGVGDEGGFAPNISSATEALDLISFAISKAGYVKGKDFFFALDVAATSLLTEKGYFFKGENTYRTSKDMVSYYEKLISKYPIIAIEDGLGEDDWSGWEYLTSKLKDKVQLIGDDLFVTNIKRLQKGFEKQVANAILIKANQIGTLTETFETIKMATNAGYSVIVSHRSGETEDTTIADIAVATPFCQFKAGAPCRTERVAKYNRLLRIFDLLDQKASYKGIDTFSSFTCNPWIASLLKA